MHRSKRPRGGSEFLALLRLQLGMLRDVGMRRALRFNFEMLRALMAGRRVLKGDYYRLISEADLYGLELSRRVFVYGSGYSLNAIGPDEWRHMSHDTTIGFNHFVRQEWIPVDFHLVRGWGVGAELATLKDLVTDFGSAVAQNPRYRDTVFVCQDDYTALFAHRLIGDRGLPRGVRVFPYRTNRTSRVPSSTLAEGLVHATGTLCDAINFVSCLGFEEIVLVGVDLYDSRYFWVDSNKTIATDYSTGELVVCDTSYRGQSVDDPHSTVANGIVEMMATWTEHLRARRIELVVYNPRSLLAEVMPIFDRGCWQDGQHKIV